jgi:hypothetical protein
MMAWTAIASLLVTSIGLVAVFLQLQKVRLALWSNTQSKLCDQSLELIRFLADHPETYHYFYSDKRLEEGDSNKIVVLYAAEALANFMEHLILQQGNLPEQQWEVWQHFIRNTYEHAPALQLFIKTHREWYADALIKIVDQCNEKLHVPRVESLP